MFPTPRSFPSCIASILPILHRVIILDKRDERQRSSTLNSVELHGTQHTQQLINYYMGDKTYIFESWTTATGREGQQQQGQEQQQGHATAVNLIDYRMRYKLGVVVYKTITSF